MSDKQKTLSSPFKISGKGLHTGSLVNITVHPADENTGYVFKRIDLPGAPAVKALVDNVISTERGTTLGKGNCIINTTEHLLAAIYGLEIDNALIEIDGPEVPILDGSSKFFVEAILKAGISEQNAEKDYFILDENITFEDTEKNVEMLMVPSEEFRITVMVDYNSPLLGTQHASLYSIKEFEKGFSSCRTFVFLRELMALVNQGLIKGGDADNALVLVDTDISMEEKEKLARTFNRDTADLQKIGIGILNNVTLQHENEPARHKLLDIVGDIALVGKPIKAHILAARPGHKTNVAFGKIIKELIKKKTGKNFNLSKEPLYNINDIEKLLPHRYPFLMVDKVMEITDNGIVGVKNITMNEPQFTGHFPGNPVMPGVLQIEAMAQVGGIFALSKVDEPEKYMTYFMKIDNVKFKRKVIPGDTLVFDLELISPIRRGIVHMRGVAYVDGQPATEAEMMAQVIKEKP